MRLVGADMRGLERIDAVLHLGVLFYRYCPFPWIRLLPLLVLARLVAAYLRWRRRRYSSR